MSTSIHRLSDGVVLMLRTPENVTNSPVIILCHGFCGIREILLPDYAEAFTQCGFSTITFDYRGFGDSDGERGRLVPNMQIDDILSIVNWVTEQPCLDKERIGLWGTSLGGCHVFGAAAKDSRIKCIVSQLAFADGEEIVTGKMNDAEKEAFLSTLDKISEKQGETGKEMYVGITRVLSDTESKTFFEKYKVLHPKMDIKIPFLTVKETLQYKPGLNASQVTCPTLIIIAENDTVNPPEQGRALFDAVMAKEKVLYTEKNARHYDIYAGEHFKNIVSIQSKWFKTYL